MCQSGECKYEDPETGKCIYRMTGKIFETMPHDAICIHRSELFYIYLKNIVIYKRGELDWQMYST